MFCKEKYLFRKVTYTSVAGSLNFIQIISYNANICKYNIKNSKTSLSHFLPVDLSLLSLFWFWWKWQAAVQVHNMDLFPRVIAGRTKERGRTLIETLNKKEVDKIVGPFPLKGRHDGFAHLSFCVVPSISSPSPPPPGGQLYICLAQYYVPQKKKKKPLHHQDLSLPNINKVYNPDLNVPLLLIVLHSLGRVEGREGRQAVDQHPYELVFVVWHPEHVYKSIDSSSPC